MTGEVERAASVIKTLVEAWQRANNRLISVDEEALRRQAETAAEVLRGFYGGGGGRLVLLKAPTGAGKTEVFAALYFYQVASGLWHSGRMYVVEPVHALLEQMARRFRAYGDAFGVRVGEDHGEVERPTYLYAAPVTLTTVDSYAYAYLAQRVDKWVERDVLTGRFTMPVGLIMHALTVFDEAHLVQDEAYLGPRALAKILCNLVNAGAYVVFSSATLPTAFIKEFKNRCSAVDERILPGKPRKVEIDSRNAVMSSDDLDCSMGALVIVNTVPRARRLYKALKERCRGKRVYVLHSLMAKEDRERTLRELEKLEEDKRIDEAVVVGTQTLEVGIDYSFARLYTELSPLDSLIQRIGRVGRRGGRAEVFVFKHEGAEPYNKELLERTEPRLSSLGDAFSDVVKLGELLDEVYDEKTVEKISKEGDGLYMRFVDYLDNLHLYSLPPEGNPQIRPSLYVDLYLLTAERISEEELLMRRIRVSYSERRADRLDKILDLVKPCEIGTLRRRGNFFEFNPQKNLDARRWANEGSLAVLCDEVGKIYDEAGLKIEEVSGLPKSGKKPRKRT